MSVSSQRATSSRPQSTARPSTSRSARPATTSFASASSPARRTSSSSGTSGSASALALTVWKPATTRASGAAHRGDLRQRELARLGAGLPVAEDDRRRDADDDPPGERVPQLAGHLGDAARRDGEEDDLGAAAGLLVRDEVVARRARADDDLLAEPAQALGQALAEVAAAADDPDHRTASSTALPTSALRLRRNHNDGRDEGPRQLPRVDRVDDDVRRRSPRRPRRCRARPARGRARPSSPRAARAAPGRATSGETATTRFPASASRMPGTARIGPMETNGFEGARKTTSAPAIASSTPGAGRASSAPS